MKWPQSRRQILHFLFSIFYSLCPMLKKLIQHQLRFLATRILRKHQPLVIGITGNVGKTTAKEAIDTVLRSHFRTRRSVKNYNNEIGVPLTILGCESAGKSSWGWLKIFLTGWTGWLFGKDYPEILVLEMGADRPGDIKYLTDFVPCFISVVNAVGEIPVHVEFFADSQALAQEKSQIIKVLPENGWAILNYDDSLVRNMRQLTRARTLLFGFDERADIAGSDFGLLKENDEPAGIALKVNYQGKSVPLRLPHLLNQHQAYSALAAVACGVALDLNLIEIVEALRKFKPLPGRLCPLAGIKNSLILDDTYNAAPAATLAALDTLAQFNKRRRVAVLGDMLELGGQTEKAHRQVGLKAAETLDLLITVGLRAKFIGETAQKQGLAPTKIYHFNDAESAMAQMEDLIQAGDVILVKASQGMRLEKIVKDIMAEPSRAKELLVRQDETWLNK